MGRVIIIRNNMNKNIHKHAKDSFDLQEKRFYYSCGGSENDKIIGTIRQDTTSDCLLLLITYTIDNEKNVEIKDLFIGTDVLIDEKNHVNYIMRCHLESSLNKRAVQSVIDRIDLDILNDFDSNCYVMASDMNKLYEDLAERVSAQRIKNNVSVETDKLCTEMPYSGAKNSSYELCHLAQKDTQAVRIYSQHIPDNNRTEFQRDRERVVNCRAFRRMVDKAQIFSAEKGDYYRTRMTHSLEVNQIAKAIAYALRLNLDLTEAIALGHDLGHTPFGHQGERTLDDILSGKIDAELHVSASMLQNGCFGRFKHNYQSARVLTELEEQYVDFPGLNVSVQVIEGVLKHTRLKKDILLKDFLRDCYIQKMNDGSDCATLEGQTVKIADEIAQRGHDVDDALTSGVITIEEFIDCLKIEKCSALKEEIEREKMRVEQSPRLLVNQKELLTARIVSTIIHYMINDVIQASGERIQKSEKGTVIDMTNTEVYVGLSEGAEKVSDYLERVIQKKVICNNEVAQADYNANMIVQTLFRKYYANPRLLHSGTLHKIFIETLMHKERKVADSAVNLNDGNIRLINEEIEEITKKLISEEDSVKHVAISERDYIIFEKRKILVRAIVDYIAGMTDGYAMQEYAKLK